MNKIMMRIVKRGEEVFRKVGRSKLIVPLRSTRSSRFFFVSDVEGRVEGRERES